jgi:hypothetical protein
MKKNLSLVFTFFLVTTINAMHRSLDSLQDSKQDSKSGYEETIGLMRREFAKKNYTTVSMFCSQISVFFQRQADETFNKKLKEEYENLARSFQERALAVVAHPRPATFEAFLYAFRA